MHMCTHAHVHRCHRCRAQRHGATDAWCGNGHIFCMSCLQRAVAQFRLGEALSFLSAVTDGSTADLRGGGTARFVAARGGMA